MELRAELVGTVWKIVKQPGERLAAGDAVLILESMKMEIPVVAPSAGVVREVRVHEGAMVQEGEVVAVLDPA
jgi:biotin carboxyl carrier protein